MRTLIVLTVLSFMTLPVSAVELGTPGPKLEKPWLWTIVPTGKVGGADAAKSGIDYLKRASNDAITETQMAQQGAIYRRAVGETFWALAPLSPVGWNNITEMAIAAGLSSGQTDNHVAYGSLRLKSPRRQQTTMFVGEDDAVKVWLNGKEVYHNFIEAGGSTDYEAEFPVTLKKGTNVLLVAVYNGIGGWSGFFGFEAETVWTPVPPRRLTVDIDQDGKVNKDDLSLLVAHLGKQRSAKPRADVDKNGTIEMKDLYLVAEFLDDPLTAAAPEFGVLSALKTAVLGNYPNPFNPETWIPYQLAEDSEVFIQIYDAGGVVVRTLALGHRSAGDYRGRSRAAYWDGRNHVGESVASGLYFYKFTAGGFSTTRKMLLLK